MRELNEFRECEEVTLRCLMVSPGSTETFQAPKKTPRDSGQTNMESFPRRVEQTLYFSIRELGDFPRQLGE